ncbi:MAG TPA: hypothetical protein VHL98_11325 [Microvirga sp.]|jgi:hypothetical protein|nr:hypothetical protein [Microvirga sp.]
MHRCVTKFVLGAAAALALGGAAQATEVNISISAGRQVASYDGDGSGYSQVGYYGDGYGYGERRYIQAPSRYGYHDGDRYYGRPVPERPSWHRPVAGRPHWAHDDCRLIIKKRVNAWGEVTVTRIRRCH